MYRPGTSNEDVSTTYCATSQKGLSGISHGGSEAVHRDRYGNQRPPPFTEIRKYRSPIHATRAAVSAQPQPYSTVVVQQQPTMSVSATHSWDHRFLHVHGLEAVNTALDATAVALGTVREWMSKPRVSPLCPPGLEYLADLSQLTFFDLMLDIPLADNDYTMSEPRGGGGGRRLSRRFQVLNSEEQQVYWVDMNVSRVSSPFETVFVDRTGEKLISVKIKEVRCCTIDVTVEAPPGHAVGSLTKRYSGGGTTSFIVKSTDGSSFLLEASDCDCICSKTNTPTTSYGQFSIFSLDREHVIGKIETQKTLITPYSWRVLTNFALSCKFEQSLQT